MFVYTHKGGFGQVQAG